VSVLCGTTANVAGAAIRNFRIGQLLSNRIDVRFDFESNIEASQVPISNLLCIGGSWHTSERNMNCPLRGVVRVTLPNKMRTLFFGDNSAAYGPIYFNDRRSCSDSGGWYGCCALHCRFLPRDNMHSAVCAMAICLSVGPSHAGIVSKRLYISIIKPFTAR